MNLHVRHEKRVFSSNFFFWKLRSKQKLEIFIFINILCLKVSSWVNLKCITQKLLLIFKFNVSFKAIIVRTYWFNLGKNSYPNDSTWNHLLTIVLFDWETGSITKVVGNVEKNAEKTSFPKKSYTSFLGTAAQIKFINSLFC